MAPSDDPMRRLDAKPLEDTEPAALCGEGWDSHEMVPHNWFEPMVYHTQRVALFFDVQG